MNEEETNSQEKGKEEERSSKITLLQNLEENEKNILFVSSVEIWIGLPL